MNTTFETSGDWVKDIRAMHEKFNVREVADTFDRDLLLKYLKFRLDMIQEEVTEAFDALEEGNADGVVDALIDNCVFTIGTLDVFHVDAHKAWSCVHEKNMEKTPGVKPERPNPWGMPDLIKPKDWTPPSHLDNLGTLKSIFE